MAPPLRPVPCVLARAVANRVMGCDDFLDCGSWNVVEGVERGYCLDVLVGDVVIGEVMIVGEILIGDVDVVDHWVFVMVTGP